MIDYVKIYLICKKIKMFYFRSLFLAMLVFGLASSCVVSKKKFLAEVAAKQKLAEEKKKLEAEKANLLKTLDELKAQVSRLRADTTVLGNEYRNWQSKYKLLDRQHTELGQQSRQTTDQLRQSLQEKQRALEEKEKLLAERERLVKELQDAIARKDAAVKALLDKVKTALAGFNSDELSVETRNGKVYVSLAEKLLFQSGQANVDKKGREALAKLADVLNKNPDIEIQIEGHTDNVPIKTVQFKDNWDLSVIRATSIVRILSQEYGVDEQRLTPAGKGETVPVASNSEATGRAKNRRIEIALSPKLDELIKILETGKP
jgi:chemotaxis protein MotB